MTARIRCPWPGGDPLYIEYHDRQWGAPLHGDRALFEFLTLEGAQAGLSWITILRKRENYWRAFDGFDIDKVARYSPVKIETILRDPGVVRNRLKVESTVANARAALKVTEEFGSLDAYIWRFVDGVPITNRFREMSEVPANTPLSEAMSRDMKKRGFRFAGPTVCYAFMQAVGMVNDHLTECFRHGEISGAPG